MKNPLDKISWKTLFIMFRRTFVSKVPAEIHIKENS